MWTYVKITLSSEGAKASEIADIMKQIGFVATLGEYDFVYKWDEKGITPKTVIDFVNTKVIKLVDEVQEKLKGKKVLLQFTTVRTK
jgi:signal recognition particle subunit SEC65